MSESHVFVRPATALDVPAIASIHRSTMIASLEAALGGELPARQRRRLAEDVFAQSWLQAITAPPSAEHRVVVAIDEGRVAGFSAFMPYDDAESARSRELTALEVAPQYQRLGHGSRLLASMVDACREDGVEKLRCWALAGDDSRSQFLHSAGFGPAGLRRLMEVGDSQVAEHAWYTLL